jgi:hypothetical protein
MASINKTINNNSTFCRAVFSGIIASFVGGLLAGIVLYNLFTGTPVYNSISKITEEIHQIQKREHNPE